MWKAVAACCFCLVIYPTAAAAEWHITPMVGLTFAGKTTLQDVEHATADIHPVFGIGVTYFTKGIFGVEALGMLTPGFFQGGTPNVLDPTQSTGRIDQSRATVLMGNVVLTVPQRWAEYSLRPFVSGGLGLLRTSQVDSDVVSITSNVAGFNIGGGAIGYFSKRTGVRFDLRYYSNLHGVDQRASDQGAISFGAVHLRYMTATVGLVFRR
jgi:hypothetical protein